MLKGNKKKAPRVLRTLQYLTFVNNRYNIRPRQAAVVHIIAFMAAAVEDMPLWVIWGIICILHKPDIVVGMYINLVCKCTHQQPATILYCWSARACVHYRANSSTI